MRCDVVLGLLLGQAEGVHLHAVAEAPELLVLHAPALEADPVPHGGEGPHLAGLLDEADPGVDEEADPADHRRQVAWVHLARGGHGVDDADGRGQGVGDLLDRGGPRFLEVVAADVHRVPARDVADGVGDGVDGESEARRGREDEGPPGQVLLHDVVLGGAGQFREGHPVVLGVGQVEAEEPGRGGVDGHRGVHLAHRDAVEELVHVAQVDDRDADLAHLPGRLGGVGVVAGLGGEVEGDGQAGLPPGQVGAVELVGLTGRGVPRVRPHHPRPVPLHYR